MGSLREFCVYSIFPIRGCSPDEFISLCEGASNLTEYLVSGWDFMTIDRLHL